MNHSCPKCNQPLIRIRRKKRDRLISHIFPVQRFQCVQHTCRWTGIQLIKSNQQKSREEESKLSSLSNTKF